MLQRKGILFMLLLSLWSFSLQAQDNDVEIKVNNAAPRVGDEVEILFDIQFFSDEIEKQLPNGVNVEGNSIGASSGKLKKIITFEKSGKYTVGPFKFEFNGKKWLLTPLS